LSPRSPAFLFIHGTVLDFAGRHEEAVRVLRESLEEGQKNTIASQGLALENLGYALLHLGRYDEATQAFEASSAIDPKRGGPYSGLAEVLLFQGIRPDRALELAEQARQYKCASASNRALDRYMLGEMWANCAWAQAMLGRYEALESLERAFREGDHNFKPVLAGIHYRAAHVFHARGERGAVAEHLGKAVQIDPRGMYGVLAAQALERGFRVEVMSYEL
jgi:tetratricopeptide (TPR) repeat protein